MRPLLQRPGAGIIFVGKIRTNDVALQAMRQRVSQYLRKPIESDDDFRLLQTALQELCWKCFDRRTMVEEKEEDPDTAGEERTGHRLARGHAFWQDKRRERRNELRERFGQPGQSAVPPGLKK